MANIAADPFLMTDVILKLGADQFEATVSAVTMTPTAPTATWKGLKKGSSFNFVGQATWMLDLDFAQDHSQVKALSLYAFDHEGESIAFEYRPKGSTASGYSGTCILTPGAIGGAVDGVATSTASFPISGKPLRIV